MFKLFIVKKDIAFFGKKLPKNTVYIIDKNGLAYACLKYPRMYQGNNPRLELWIYDYHTNAWTWGVYQDEITLLIHDAYIYNMRTRPKVDTNNYSAMMKHSRKKKRSSGGSREFVETVTDYACSVTAPFADFGRAVRVIK